MNYYNLNQHTEKTTLKNAVLKSISNDTGLYMPEKICTLSDAFFESFYQMSLQEISFEVANVQFGDDIESSALKRIVDHAMNFPIPLKKLSDQMYVLELFHGPTLAFKDVGARFMAGLFEYFLQDDQREVTILVATSGDTGSAVADAFFNKKGIKVCILYPSGKVSPLQEKQLTTMGENITALEVDGNFDDCQRLVKKAFSDEALNRKIQLTSANSINFARLFPQSFYYFYALAQLGKTNKPITVSVPSGNFGNLTAGLIAKKMGLPIQTFIASTNSNHAIPDYLTSGSFTPYPIQHTISNAMDVALPSNFPRMLALYDNEYANMINDVKGHWCTDEETLQAMKVLQEQYQYQADPHGAIAFDGLMKVGNLKDGIGIFLESAHPAKFPDAVREVSGDEVEIPIALKGLINLEKKSIPLENDYQALFNYLID